MQRSHCTEQDSLRTLDFRQKSFAQRRHNNLCMVVQIDTDLVEV